MLAYDSDAIAVTSCWGGACPPTPCLFHSSFVYGRAVLGSFLFKYIPKKTEHGEREKGKRRTKKE